MSFLFSAFLLARTCADLDKLVSVQGMIVRTSAVTPDLKQGFFECRVCQHGVSVSIDRGPCRPANSRPLHHARDFKAQTTRRASPVPTSVRIAPLLGVPIN